MLVIKNSPQNLLKESLVWPSRLLVASWLLYAGCSRQPPASSTSGDGTTGLPPAPQTKTLAMATNATTTSTEPTPEGLVVGKAFSKIGVLTSQVPNSIEKQVQTIAQSALLLALIDKDLASQLSNHQGSVLVIPIAKLGNASGYISNLGPQFSGIAALATRQITNSNADAFTIGIGDLENNTKTSLVFVEGRVFNSAMGTATVFNHELWHVVGDQDQGADGTARAKNEIRAFTLSSRYVATLAEFVSAHESDNGKRARLLEELSGLLEKERGLLRFWRSKLP